MTEHYPQLVGLFNERFGSDEQSDDDFGCWRTVEAPFNESALDDFLREKADRFMKCFRGRSCIAMKGKMGKEVDNEIYQMDS